MPVATWLSHGPGISVSWDRCGLIFMSYFPMRWLVLFWHEDWGKRGFLSIPLMVTKGCRKWLLKCTLRIAISALRNLGTNYYFSSTSVCQLLLGFERWIMLTRGMGARGGIPGRAETLAKESGRRHCVEKRGECRRGRDEASKGAGWRAQLPFRPVPGSGCLLLNPWFSYIIVCEKSSRLG